MLARMKDHIIRFIKKINNDDNKNIQKLNFVFEVPLCDVITESLTKSCMNQFIIPCVLVKLNPCSEI